MNSTAVKITAAVLVVAAIVLGLIAYQTSKNLSQPPPDIVVAPSTTDTEIGTRVVVAVRPIKAYQSITPEDVEVHPLVVVPLHYFRDPSEVVGRSPITDIDVGVPLTGRYFGNVSALAQSIPPGHKAIALKIDDVVAVGSFVQPGDVVDVLLFVRGGDSAVTATETQSRILLQAVRVLAFEERVLLQPVQSENNEQPGQKPNQSGKRIQTVVVAVSDEETTRVMLGASLGDLRLALHGAPKTDLEPAGEGADDFFDVGGPSPLAPGDLSKGLAARDEAERVVTLRELTAIQQSRETPPKRATTVASAGSAQAKDKDGPPAAYVHRGAETQKVNKDGVVLK